MALVSFIDWLDITSVLLLVFAFFVVFYWLQRPRNLPPGPWRFPIVGWLPQLMWYMYKGEEMHLLATRLAEKYGKIYSFDLFGLVFVVLNDFATVREGNYDRALQNKGYNNTLAEALFGSNCKWQL